MKTYSLVPRLLIAFLIFTALFSALTLPVLGQTITPLVGCTGLDCNLCSFFGLFQGIIRFLLFISIPIASLLFAYAGVLYFTSAGDHGKLEKGKQIFIDVLIGFVIALGSWLIVETILRATLKPTFFTDWNTVKCEGVRQGTSPLAPGQAPGTGTGAVQPPAPTPTPVTPKPTPTGPQPTSPAGKQVDDLPNGIPTNISTLNLQQQQIEGLSGVTDKEPKILLQAFKSCQEKGKVATKVDFTNGNYVCTDSTR